MDVLANECDVVGAMGDLVRVSQGLTDISVTRVIMTDQSLHHLAKLKHLKRVSLIPCFLSRGFTTDGVIRLLNGTSRRSLAEVRLKSANSRLFDSSQLQHEISRMAKETGRVIERLNIDEEWMDVQLQPMQQKRATTAFLPFYCDP